MALKMRKSKDAAYSLSTLGQQLIINDVNGEPVTLHVCVPGLVRQLRWLLVARDELNRFMRTPADTQ